MAAQSGSSQSVAPSKSSVTHCSPGSSWLLPHPGGSVDDVEVVLDVDVLDVDVVDGGIGQAIAIGLSKARKKGAKVPPKKSKKS